MIVLSLGLGVATRSLPLSTAYAVRTKIGAGECVALGIVLLGSAALGGLACLGLIVTGILGLKFLDSLRGIRLP
jgi:quaternary ammonium compound-resistance protein SugE